jgi:hypothetical protein
MEIVKNLVSKVYDDILVLIPPSICFLQDL